MYTGNRIAGSNPAPSVAYAGIGRSSTRTTSGRCSRRPVATATAKAVFRTLGDNKAYWVFTYRIGGKEREKSIGPYPEVSLSEARIKHAALRARVLNDKIDPVGEKRAAKAARAHAASVPSFGEMADQYIASHEASWKNPKHRDQWVMTLGKYCSAIQPGAAGRQAGRLSGAQGLAADLDHDAKDRIAAQRPHRGGVRHRPSAGLH